MLMKHGPIEASHTRLPKIDSLESSVLMKHGPIEAGVSVCVPYYMSDVFRAHEARPH